MPRDRKPTNHYDPSKEAAKPQWAGTSSVAPPPPPMAVVAPTTTFPVFTGKHTLFVEDSDSDDDKGKGVASQSSSPPAKKAKYDDKGKGVASPSATPAKTAKHTRFTYDDE